MVKCDAINMLPYIAMKIIHINDNNFTYIKILIDTFNKISVFYLILIRNIQWTILIKLPESESSVVGWE